MPRRAFPVVDSVTDPSLFMLEAEYEEERAAIEAVSPGCFVLFPNPTSNELRLDLKEHIGKSADVRIQDYHGPGHAADQHHPPSAARPAAGMSRRPSRPNIYIATIQVEGGQPMSQCFVVAEPVSGFGRHQDEAMHR